MKIIKEVIVFSEQGDPREIKTWSNVPFFLVNTLETRNILVRSVDLSVQGLIHKIFRKVYEFFTSKLFKNAELYYSRTLFHSYATNQRIKKAIRKYKKADIFIFTSFSQSASRHSLKPSILFCDWTIQHYVQYFLGRSPNYFERIAIRKQNKIIEEAAAVFVLFPSVANKMKTTYSNPNIYYNGNVINSVINSYANSIEAKAAGNNLLFVGSKKYLKGASDLITSYISLKKQYPDLKLHIIGIDKSDLPIWAEGVHFYGYLDKGKKDDLQKYYELLKSARIFINTNPKWASFSAALEAMYFYTPLIITAYTEFIDTFGEEITFGSYYNPNESKLSEVIGMMLKNEDYKLMCENSHAAAKEHTWELYVDRLLKTTTNLVADRAEGNI